MRIARGFALLWFALPSAASTAEPASATPGLQAVMPPAVGWRRDFHQHPELGNREIRTSGVVAAHLRSLGFVGATPPGQDPRAAPTNHSPQFSVDVAALPLALDALLRSTLAALQPAAAP